MLRPRAKTAHAILALRSQPSVTQIFQIFFHFPFRPFPGVNFAGLPAISGVIFFGPGAPVLIVQKFLPPLFCLPEHPEAGTAPFSAGSRAGRERARKTDKNRAAATLPERYARRSRFLSGILFLLLKKAAMRAWPSFLREYLNPWVAGGYFLLLSSTALNIAGLRGLSFLNGPVMESFGYVFVLFLSRLFFGERITKRKLAGVGCILAGMLIFYL